MSLTQRLLRRFTADPRLARMLHGGLSGLLGRGLALLVSAVSLPLTVRYLGRLEYGIWITISSSVIMLSVLDLGIANTLTNQLSEAYATDDRTRAQRAYSTAFWLTCAVSLVLGLGSFLVWRMVDWGRLLNLTEASLAAQARTAIAISVLYFLLSMPLNLANRVLSGYQKVHISNYFSMFNSVLGLLAIVVAMLFHGGLVELTVVYCAAMLAGSLLLNGWLLFYHQPWILPRPGVANAAVARTLFRQGSLFFLLQLTGLVVFNSDNLVITHFLGAAEVTPYSIAWRLTSYAALLQSLLIPSFWPAFTEAYRKREMHWVRSTYHGMVRKTFLAVCGAALVIGLVGRPFIRLWTGSGANVPSATLLWTMAGWAVLVSITTNQALLLTATGRLRLEAGVAVLAAIMNLFLSIFLVQRIGSIGVILSTILSFAVCMVGPQQYEVNRVLRGDFLPAPLTPDLVAEEALP